MTGEWLRWAIIGTKSRHRTITALARTIYDRQHPDRVALTPSARAFIAAGGEDWWAPLAYAEEILRATTEWTQAVPRLLDAAESYGCTRKTLTQTLRVYLTGSTVSEPLEIVLDLIGRKAVLERLEELWSRS